MRLVQGPLIAELGAAAGLRMRLADELVAGLEFAGEFKPSPGFCGPFGKHDAVVSVDKLREDRDAWNACVLDHVKPSEWSEDLFADAMEDWAAGFMTEPKPLHTLDLKQVSLTRRLAAREERNGVPRTRSVDHFTESGINLSIQPADSPKHETLDHVVSLIILVMSLGISPQMWKRDISKAFRRVPIKKGIS